MQRGNGAVIGKQNTPTASVATGIWALNEVQRAVRDGIWPVNSDPYFENVSLLLHGNGTNGAQNNTFLDSSTNNFTITRNGNTTQGAFSPYGDNWSNYFDGSGDYLAFPAMSGFGTGDFTIEAWVYPVVSGTARMIVDTRTPDILGPYALSITTSDKLDFLFSGSAPLRVTSTASIAANTWTHIAVSRASGTLRLFINGVQDGSVATSASITGNAVMWIGAGRADGSGNPGYYFNGYISNFRTLNGTGLYTTTFTPPAAPLTAITNTQVLTCQSNRFVDNSTNNFTITRNGDVSVQRFSPFNPTAPYAAGTIGGSGYFDGAGDYLSAAGGTSLSFGTGDFTVEGWFYTASPATNRGLFQISTTAGGLEAGNINNIAVYCTSSVLGVYYNDTFKAGTTAIRGSAWTHFALVRNSGTIKLYVNGVADAGFGSNTDTRNYTGGNIAVGGYFSTSYLWNGYIANFKTIKGTAVYTTDFTPPTSPVTGGALLLNFTNGGIIDNAMMNDLETVGNAQISTSVSKFGGGSLAFDGTGDWLTIPSSPQLLMGTGDFTIEAWIYLNTTASAFPIVYNTDSSQVIGSGEYAFIFNPALGLRFVLNSNGTAFQIDLNQGSAAGWSTGTWYHVALVRVGNVFSIYRNGISLGTNTTAGAVVGALLPLYVGGQPLDPLSSNGYIDDLRITKGVARYTANFTPPNGAFADK